MAANEIVAAPLTVWLAATGTAFPDIDADPTTPWVKLGTSGTKNYDEKGVTITHDAKYETFTPAGSTAPRKAFRTSESLLIELDLVDLTAAQYAQILNDASVTDTSAGVGQAGQSSFDLLQGTTVSLFALLARGVSPHDPSMNAQYQVPIVYQATAPKPVFMKGTPASLACQFAALEDDTDGFGTLVIQTADAS